MNNERDEFTTGRKKQERYDEDETDSDDFQEKVRKLPSASSTS